MLPPMSSARDDVEVPSSVERKELRESRRSCASWDNLVARHRLLPLQPRSAVAIAPAARDKAKKSKSSSKSVMGLMQVEGSPKDEQLPDKQKLAAPVKSVVDKFQLLPEFLKVRGLVKQHLDSFNYFVNTGIRKIVRANDRIVSGIDPSIFLRFKDVRIGQPSMTVDGVSEKLNPHMCRLSDMTYAAPILVNIEYVQGSHTEKTTMEKNDVVIGRIPIMLRSCRCVLYGKDEAELARLGECPLDPGGYFIIKGTEKVLLIQEQLSKNRVIIDTDKKGNINASVTSSTETVKSKTVIQMEKGKMYLLLNQFVKKIPIMVVMKAMGIESDQEVVQMVGRDPRYSALLLPSIEVKRSTFGSPPNDREGRAFSILRDVFLANVPVHNNNFRPKCFYVAVMLRRMVEAMLNKDAMDDKDYVGNKRLELSGQLVSLLFEDLFKTMISEVQKTVDIILSKPSRSSRFDLSQFIVRDSITVGLERTLSTGNFDVKRFKMHRKGMTQVLARLSFIGTLGHMTRVSPQFEKSRKVSGPRALQPSQWGMLCPCDTPEGEACGLVKNLALMTHVTTDEEEGSNFSSYCVCEGYALFENDLNSVRECDFLSDQPLCYCLGVEDLELLSGEELHNPNSFLVIFNGLILGKHRRPKCFADVMRKLRRAGKIGEFVSVFVNEKQRCVYIASDGGRVCRPLVIADKGISRIKEHHMKELLDGVRSFDDFLREGLIEYLDVNEENNALIALYEGDATPDTTHIEIEPFTILGVIAGLIPYPHHNQSPRNTYQCAMGKQAMGNIAFNQLCRMDSLLYLLVYPQRPLLTTRTIELVGYDKLGAGQNATVAVMSYSGYDIEDAIVMNKSSLDRGFGRCIVVKKYTARYTAINQKYANSTSDRILRPDRTGPGAERMQILDDDGLAAPGEIIKPNDVYINKESPLETRGSIMSPTGQTDSRYRSARQTYKGPDGETCVVDRVALCSDKNGDLCIKFLIRHTRRPELGDKFSSRHGQKGVCGTIVQQEDFPFSERGICPDLIMNPHGFPSRMTVGKMIELLGGKAGVSCGRFHYGSAFGEPSGHADTVESISETLVKHGFSYNGKDMIYSGITGCPLQAYIFMGPIYYQKLKHMVLDKMHARGSGPRVMLTRQPTEGRARNGGLRVGEMERDCLIAYGASMLIFERLMVSSDPFEVQLLRWTRLRNQSAVLIHPFNLPPGFISFCTKVLDIAVCRVCGLLGYYNHKLKAGICSTCKNGDNISSMKLPYACKLLIQELQSMNIVPRLKLAEA
ncbi:DNA-directed RNA polymerase III subunit 2 [Citrus sinensis]|uniref:DNA-directed RNA polymerase III subunit 2 n=1 Tax=Citrus sinensis TaxID=2711 RepID=A0ACB8KDC0_CITSI|nr:DNA-directed RNA polymerase III subunit 2 [Citrus sinensis]